MIEITIGNSKNTTNPDHSKISVNPNTSRNTEKQPLTGQLGSVKKSDELLSKQGGSGTHINSGYRLLRALKRGWRWSGSGAGTRDTELAEVASEGKKLYEKAEALRDIQKKENEMPSLPLSLKSRTGMAVGAAVILGGAGLCWRQFSQYGRPDARPVNRYSAGQAATAVVSMTEPTDSFENHYTPYDKKTFSSKRARRHLATKKPSTSPAPDVIKKKLFDFSCAKEREDLSFANVLRNIADSLNGPMQKIGEEWQITYNYNTLKKGCPEKKDKEYLLNIMRYIDLVTNRVTGFFPSFAPIIVLQNLIPPVLKSIADHVDGKEINANLIMEINNQLLTLPLLFSSSLDLHGRNMLAQERDGIAKSVIPEKLELKKGNAYVSIYGGQYKLMRDPEGVCIYDLDIKSLQLRKKHISYIRSHKKWVVTKDSKVMQPEAEDGEAGLVKSLRLITYARNEAKNTDSTGSTVKYITEILVKSGLLKRENLELVQSKIIHSDFSFGYIKELVNIEKESQLLKVKEGQLLIFTDTQGGSINIQHLMLATGNGLFAGINNDRISSAFDSGSTIIAAEQLGSFSHRQLTTSEGNKFIVYAGFLKDTKVNYYDNYRDAVLNLEEKNYQSDSAHAVASVLSMTGDLSSEFVSVLDESKKKQIPLKVFFNSDEKWLSKEDLAEGVPPGGIIFLTNHLNGNYEQGTFALRINDDEFFIPKLYKSTTVTGGVSTIYNIKALRESIEERDLMIKKVEFNIAGARTQALLGKDARFYAVDNVLYIRAHGLPMTINYMSPLEIVNIIKGLSNNKKIDLKKISTIVLESCFGATGFPSTGKAISASMNKKVVAYRGKYRTGNGAEEANRVVYTPSPLSHLEKMVADITERNIDFIRKMRGIYSYFKNTETEPEPSTSNRSKRNNPYFSLLLADIGRLILGKKDIHKFIEDNHFFYGHIKGHEEYVSNKFLTYPPVNSLEFFELSMHIIFISSQASNYLDSYISKNKKNSKNNNTTLVLERKSEREDNKKVVSYLVNSITAELAGISDAMGISNVNKYLSAKRWSDFGFPGDIYWDEQKNRYFILKHEGVPSNHYWYYPDDALNDASWLDAGRHPGTLEQPKDWSEYGKSGSIYYEHGYGYLMLKKDGRPSDHNWYFPPTGESSENWNFIVWNAGTFNTPLEWENDGFSGSVYYYGENESFYILKQSGNPSEHIWYFPCAGTDDENWIYAGKNRGTLDSPKKWVEYGKTGSIYFDAAYGYLILKTDGRPSDNNWFFPDKGQSDSHWKFVSFETGSFDSPKLENTEGTAGEVYYSVKDKSFYILRKDGKPSSHGWYYPAQGVDNDNWFYGGKNSGTQVSPKKWDEYGKAGSIYYEEGEGYFRLELEGRPSEHSWYFPKNGKPNNYWSLIFYETGSFYLPKIQPDRGKPGDIYYSNENACFYIMRKQGRPYGQRWLYPPAGTDNGNWLYGGRNSGNIDAPKRWSEYGKAGSLYYKSSYGYFTLKTEGRPSENKWYFPDNGHSDDHWKFISLKMGSFTEPKRQNAEGIAGEVYYSDEKQAFYILKKPGNPFNCGWKFPSDDDGHWIYAGENRGTPDAPKSWHEYGKTGTVYHEAGYGYLTLKSNGRPSDNNWFYPENGGSNAHWNFISWEMGSFTSPKNKNVTGLAGEIYYSDNNELFYILKNSGNPLLNGWYFPYGKADNQNWFYAGKNRGTLDSPKVWSEYGKTGSVYFKINNGYFILQTEGRPSERKWYFPDNGKSNEHWRFICKETGSFTAPKRINADGIAGDVYYSDELEEYYILKNPGNPLVNGWYFPFDDNENWYFSGPNKGTVDSPKTWRQYGKPGSVYYDIKHGFLTLRNEGRPSDNNWKFPDPTQSNQYWNFISFLPGTFSDPKDYKKKGIPGDVYYSEKQKCFFLLKNEGTPSINDWFFPQGKKSNDHWVFAGEKKGTLDSPKSWNEYGKPGLIYYKKGYGYLMLKTEGNPSEKNWYFPENGISDSHWIFIKR